MVTADIATSRPLARHVPSSPGPQHEWSLPTLRLGGLGEAFERRVLAAARMVTADIATVLRSSPHPTVPIAAARMVTADIATPH